MMQSVRTAAVHFALVAMMLRAFLPMGWMPNPAGAAASFFVVCTMNGPTQQADQHNQGKHTPDDGQHNHEECPFAATPHIAAPATVAQIALPSLFGRFSNPPGAFVAAPRAAAYQPQSPRAPPLAT